MPVRDETRVHRALVLGDLARLVLLDTRMDERDPPPIDEADWNRADRRVMSDAQERWLRGLLAEGDVSFTIVGNQVVLAPFAAQNNVDAWDGYPAQRARVLEAIAAAPSPVVVVTGDTHASLVLDLPGPGYDASTQAGAIGVEWGTSAVSSPTLSSDPRATERYLLESTPHLRFTEQEHRGFVLLDLTHERARGELWLIDGVERPDEGRATLVRAFETTASDRASREASPEPSAPAADAPPRAP
jgi:alkaline phosphatase D